jgi:drug/metabolite transporter (DMT)-like permease
MASADWSIAVGVLTFIVALIFAVYFYLTYKKMSLVIFTASIATYIFAVFYTWDVFELNKNWVLAILGVSAILMILVGTYFSKVDYKKTKSSTKTH